MMHRLFLLQTQAESAEFASVQERSWRGGGRRAESRVARRPAVSGSRYRRQRQRSRWRQSLRRHAGSRGVAFAAAQPPANGPRSSADDRGTKSRGSLAGLSVATRTTTACTQGSNETAAAASSRLSRLPRPQVDTARTGQAVAGSPGRLSDTARSPGQVAGSPTVNRRHSTVVESATRIERWRYRYRREQSAVAA